MRVEGPGLLSGVAGVRSGESGFDGREIGREVALELLALSTWKDEYDLPNHHLGSFTLESELARNTNNESSSSAAYVSLVTR